MPYYTKDPKRDHNFDNHPYIYIYVYTSRAYTIYRFRYTSYSFFMVLANGLCIGSDITKAWRRFREYSATEIHNKAQPHLSRSSTPTHLTPCTYAGPRLISQLGFICKTSGDSKVNEGMRVGGFHQAHHCQQFLLLYSSPTTLHEAILQPVQ